MTRMSILLIVMGNAIIVLTKDKPTMSADLEYLVWLVVTVSIMFHTWIRNSSVRPGVQLQEKEQQPAEVSRYV